MSKPTALLQHTPLADSSRARLTIDAGIRSPYRVSPLLYGKFCEHLGTNIYNGMEAQVLFNPTFGHWAFAGAESDLGRVDGGTVPEGDRARIAQRIQVYAERLGWLTPAWLEEGYRMGAAFGWVPEGDVRLSPDVGPYGGRAQRVEVMDGRGGIGQRTYLPLHRTRGYEFRLVGRAVRPVEAELALSPTDESGRVGAPLARARVRLGRDWSAVTGRLDIGASARIDPGAPYQFALTAPAGANLVLGRILLYPDDHAGGADPDVIRFLREAGLPLLRWPGGNFSSGYHWRDGVGPVDARPTYANPAWECLEYNLFGTDEFIAFCRAVACEPMICVNGGNGTAEEAAAWVEYCNAPVTSPMGRLRAENGHPEPYGVHYWEVGNELEGRWQVSWTTPGGYADRYERFSAAMRAADPTIRLVACGTQGSSTGEWTSCLLESAGVGVEVVSDHLLVGGEVNRDTDGAELFHAFMGFPRTLVSRYTSLADAMRRAGIAEPRVAITELQLFADFQGPFDPLAGLNPAAMPTPATISEALYDAAIIHRCIRLEGLVELLTHSATVNHGGGLRKVRERVWANPCHWGHAMGVALAGGTPLGVRLNCGTFSTENYYGQIPPHGGHPVLDAMPVLSADGREVQLMLVHLSATTGPVELELSLEGLEVQPVADVLTLRGERMSDQNTPEEPERIVPRPSTLAVQHGRASLRLEPYSLARVTLHVAQR